MIMNNKQYMTILAIWTNLMSNVRPVITRILIIFAEEIGMLIRVQKLISLQTQGQAVKENK